MYSEGRPYHLIAGEGFLEPLAAIAEDQLVELPDPTSERNPDSKSLFVISDLVAWKMLAHRNIDARVYLLQVVSR